MIRMRQAAPTVIVFMAYALFGTVTLYAAESAVTWDAMKTFFYETLAAVMVTAVLVAGGLIAFILKRDRDINGHRVSEVMTALAAVTTGLADAARALKEHNESEWAHGPASKHNHDPMNQKLDELAKKLAETHSEIVALRAEHNTIQAAEQDVCALLNSLRGARAEVRRLSDEPSSDHTKERKSL